MSTCAVRVSTSVHLVKSGQSANGVRVLRAWCPHVHQIYTLNFIEFYSFLAYCIMFKRGAFKGKFSISYETMWTTWTCGPAHRASPGRHSMLSIRIRRNSHNNSLTNSKFFQFLQDPCVVTAQGYRRDQLGASVKLLDSRELFTH